MLNVAVLLAMVLLGVALLLNTWRLYRGPDATGRILALDTLYINAAAAIVLQRGPPLAQTSVRPHRGAAGVLSQRVALQQALRRR